MKFKLNPMIDFFSNSSFLLVLGIVFGALSLYLVNKSAEKKANLDKQEILEYTKTVVDSSVKQTVTQMNGKFQGVFEKMEIGAEASINAINGEGQHIIKNLKEDSKRASAEIKFTLDELKDYSERLKLEKPVYLSLTYRIDKKFLDEDANDYRPVKTAIILQNYLSSCNYTLIINRKIISKDNSMKYELVASYNTISSSHKFDNDPFSRDITNSLVLVNPEAIVEDHRLVEYTFNIMLSTTTIGNHSSIKVGDGVGFEKRIQNHQNNHIYEITDNSQTIGEFYLTNSFNEKFRLKLETVYELGIIPESEHIGTYWFEIIEKNIIGAKLGLPKWNRTDSVPAFEKISSSFGF